MISHLRIQDFATIEQVEVDFHSGLNVITGETGSGKSVVISAISLALGARADSTFIRSGCDKAVVQMVAEVDNREVVITREISASGKNLCKIDGEIVSLTQLSLLAGRLADLHGQYDHQYLLNPANHIKLVDAYEERLIDQAREKVSDLYMAWVDAKSNLEGLKQEAADNERKIADMRYQIKEIQEAQLVPGEDMKLTDALQEMQHKEEIYQALGQAYEDAKESNLNASDVINRVITDLKPVTSISKEATFLQDEISDIYYRFEDICHRLREARDACVFSPQDIEIANDRLYAIRQLKNKYGDTIEAVLEHAETQEKEVRRLQNQDADIASLELELRTLEDMLREETERLTGLRRTAASTLQEKIQNELRNLNFDNVEVICDFRQKDSYSRDGKDIVEFLISTNLGERPKPLAKIISGGEMSRIMLAFKMIIADYDGIPTMIFDEIDAGISGETASLVGKTIKALAQTRQVITITHLPQIAAYGDHNYRISKSSDDAATYTTMEILSESQKAAEIARLIAGLSASDLTMASALEMIEMTRF